MLYIMRYDDYPDIEEAIKIVGKPRLTWADGVFNEYALTHDLNKDPWFAYVLKEIDRCDIPMPNVARDIQTGRTHSFDKVSTGVRVAWLMRYYPDKWLFPSAYLGENCYQAMLNAGSYEDIIVYNNSNMLCSEIQGYCMDNCSGTFCDYKTHKQYIIIPGGTVCWDYSMEGLTDDF